MQIKAPTLRDAWLGVMGRFQEGKGVVTNKFRGDIFLNLFDLLILSETQDTVGMVLEEIGYTESKVQHLLRTYIDPHELKAWVEQIHETEAKYGQADSDILLQTVRSSRHTNGPCLLGFSYRSRGGPCLTVYSRSADFPHTAFADALLINAIATLAAGGPCRVRWFIASARLRSRVANFYTAWCYLQHHSHPTHLNAWARGPYHPLFTNPEFHEHAVKGWQKFVVENHPVSFRKLEALQTLGQRALGVTPMLGVQTTSSAFLKRLQDACKGVNVWRTASNETPSSLE